MGFTLLSPSWVLNLSDFFLGLNPNPGVWRMKIPSMESLGDAAVHEPRDTSGAAPRDSALTGAIE